MEVVDLIAVIVVWFVVISMAIKDMFFHRKKVVKEVLGKNVQINDCSTHKYRYILEPIFSNPTDEYDLKGTQIYLEIITKTRSRMASLFICGDSLHITYNLCCGKDIRAYFHVIRKKALASITKVRAIHNCQTEGAKIFLEGIECNDLKNGQRIYYSVQEFIANEDIELALVHEVKEQELHLFSKQTLIPNFVPRAIEDFGRPLKTIRTADSNPEQSNGVITSAKLNILEAFIFEAFLLVLTFFLTVTILVYFGDTYNMNNTTIGATLLPGFFALSLTESLATIYRDYIKYYYNLKCAPMLIESKTHHKKWSFVKNSFLSLVMMCAVLSSFSIPFMIDSRNSKTTLADEYGFKIAENSRSNQICFLLIHLTASLLVTVTVWMFMFGLIRFIYRSNFKYSEVETVLDLESAKYSQISPAIRQSFEELNNQKGNSVNERSVKVKPESTCTDNISVEHKGKALGKKVEKTDSQTSTTLSNTLRSTLMKKTDKLSNRTTGQLDLGVDRLERELADKERMRRLITTSVIAKPTKSVGFINPEDFRITLSKIDCQPKGNNDNKKKFKK